MNDSFHPTALDEDVSSAIQPYPGLRPFRRDEDFLFFGRDAQATELLGRLRKNRFLAVLGSSGSGKSSLVRAGLLPALDGGAVAQVGSSWEIAVMRPGGDPLGYLARALCDAELYEAPEGDEDIFPYLRATLNRSRRGLPEAVRQSSLAPGASFLLVVDQFEELFRFGQGSPAHQHAAAKFVDLLLGAVEQDAIPGYVLLTMRADFLGECSRLPGLVDAINRSKYLIPRMSRDELREVIEGPAQVAGGQIAPRLSQRLLNDIGEDPDQLPILQHALMRTWSYRHANGDGASHDQAPGSVAPVDLNHFYATGGLREALSRHADEVYDSLPDDRHREIARRVFQTLTVREPDGQDIRRPTRLEALAEVADARLEEVITIVDAYRQPGVTFIMPGPEVELRPNTIVDVSHESLMRVWRRLHAWVEDEAQSARIFGRLTDTAKLWKAGEAGLYRDPDLEIARKWTESAEPNAAWAALYGGGYDEAMEFLTASHDAAEASARAREEERQRRIANAERLSELQAKAAKGMRRFAVSLSVGLLLAVGLSFWALSLRHEAEEATEQARVLLSESRHRQGVGTLRIAQSLIEDGNFFDAKLFAAKALGFSGFGRSGQDDAFRDEFPVWLTPGSDEFKTAETLIRGEADFLPLWRTGTVQQGRPGRPGGQTNSLFVLPDGRRLVDVRRELVRVWDSESGEIVHEWTAHEEWTMGAALSPDARRLATASEDRSVKIWRTDTWALERVLTGHDDTVATVAFSADGSRLASLTDQGTVYIYDTDSFEMIRAMSFELDRITGPGLEFHPSGRWILVTSHHNPVLRLWEVETGRRLDDAAGGMGRLATFSPDGRWLGVAHGDGWTRLAGEVELWRVDVANVDGGSPPTFTRTHRWTIQPNARFLRFNTSSNLLAVGSHGSVQLFEVLEGGRVSMIRTQPGPRSVEFSPDGKTLFVAGNSTIRSFRLSDGEPIRPPQIHDGTWLDAEFHPDGRTFATAGEDGDIRIWDTRTGRVRRTLRSHSGRVTDIGYGPEGRILASVSTDGTIRLWDVDPSKNGDSRAKARVQVIPVAEGEPVTAATLSIHADGKMLACKTRVHRENPRRYEGMVWLVDRATGDRRLLVPAESGERGLWGFSPGGGILALSKGSAIELWDWKKGEIARRADGTPRVLRAYQDSITRVAFDPRGRYLVSSGFFRAEFVLWDLSTDMAVETKGEIPTYNKFYANFSPDGRYLGVYRGLIPTDGASRSRCEIWELRRGQSVPLKRIAVLSGRPWGRGDVRMAPGNRLLLVRESDVGVELQHFSRGQERYRIPSPNADFSSLTQRAACYDAERDRLFVGTDDGEIRIYEISSGAFLGSMHFEESWSEHGSRVTGIRLSPDRTRLYATTQTALNVWSLDGLKADLITSVEIPPAVMQLGIDDRIRVWGGGFTNFDLSSDGELIATSGFKIRSARDPHQVLSEFPERAAAFPMKCVFRPGRRELATQRFQREVWVHDLSDPTSPREVFRTTWSGNPAGMSYTADGTRLLLSFAEHIEVLDADTGRVVNKLEGSYTVEGSPSGRWIASGQMDGRLKVLDAKTGDVVFEVQAHAERIGSLAFSADEKQLVSIAATSICVWDLGAGLEESLDLASYVGDLEWDLDGIRHKRREPVSNLYASPEAKFKSAPRNSLPRFLGRGGDPVRASRGLFWRYLREGSVDSARIVLREIPAEAGTARERSALCDLYVGRARDEGTSRAFKLLQLRRALEVKPEDEAALELKAEIEAR